MHKSFCVKPSLWTGVAGVVVASWALAGCNTNCPNCSTSAQSAGTADEKTTSADKLPGLKELDPSDREIARKQKVCPISGEPLGSMGKPFKVAYKDRVVFLCCDGCKADFDKEPEKWLKKIDGDGDQLKKNDSEKK